MGKRKRSDEEIRRKIRRLECRLNRRATPSNSDEYNDESEHSFSSNHGIRSVVSMPLDANTDNIDPITHNLDDCVAIQEHTADMATSVTISNKDGDTTSELPALTADILEALGVSKNKVEVFAPKIRDEISERWGQIIVDGLSKESIQKILENIHIPENFKLLKAPALNAEIATVLSESTKNRDKRLEKAQNHLGLGIAAITNLMSALINGDMEKTYIVKRLSELGQLLLDLHCQNTYARRKLITFNLDKKFLSMIQGVKRDSLLFGENLGDKIKASKTAEKSGLQIKRTFEPQPSTSTYRSNQPPARQGNSRGPPRSQVLRGKRGGPRNPGPSQTYRRPPPVATDRNNTSTKTNNNKSVHKN